MNIDPNWTEIAGGLCLFGDRNRPRFVKTLLWTISPLTWGQSGLAYDRTLIDHPVSNIDFETASRIASSLGSRIPTTVEWEWMASGEEQRLYPWGNTDWYPGLANLRPAGIGSSTPVGLSLGKTPQGILDVAGNVWEWTSTILLGKAAIIRGGSYASEIVHARTKFINAAPVELASPGIGLRLVKDL